MYASTLDMPPTPPLPIFIPFLLFLTLPISPPPLPLIPAPYNPSPLSRFPGVITLTMSHSIGEKADCHGKKYY